MLGSMPAPRQNASTPVVASPLDSARFGRSGSDLSERASMDGDVSAVSVLRSYGRVCICQSSGCLRGCVTVLNSDSAESDSRSEAKPLRAGLPLVVAGGGAF